MTATRTTFSPDYKAKVALAAIKGELTVSEISSNYGVHGTQVTKWKKQAMDELNQVFSDKREKKDKSQEQLIDELYKQIGQLKVELDWLKKKSGQHR
jgi:transposase-like protein